MIDARGAVTNPFGRKPMGTVIGFAIHHSVTTSGPAATEGQELAHIKRIDEAHVLQEFGGFGYHLAGFASGRSFLCGDLSGQRAHVKGRNHELIGIVAIGDFTSGLPAPPQINALIDCLQVARQTYGNLEVRGHNDWALPGEGTICAGALNGYGWGAPMPPPGASVERVLQALQAALATTWVYQTTSAWPAHDREIIKQEANR